jgi:hypothetical protein
MTMKTILTTAVALATCIGLSFQAWAAGPGAPNGQPFQAIDSGFNALQQELGTLQNQIAVLNSKLDTLIAGVGNNPPMVPFLVMDTTGGVCNRAATNSANPEIIIESDGGEGHFVVTSVLLKTGGTGVPITGFFALSINTVTINGVRFDTRTGNLVGPTDGSGVLESVDLMGTPVRRTSLFGDTPPGGNFPHQIVAENYGVNDVAIRLFCRSDDEDLSIAVVAAAGWKRTGDTITVTYVPGS